MNAIQKQDIEEFAMTFALAEDLRDSTFLITGATGLIGFTLIHCLLNLGRNIRIVAPLRNTCKALSMFDTAEGIQFYECDLETFDFERVNDVDYIVHCAAPTSSKFFVEHPVETYYSITHITENLLRYATKHPVKSFVYLSSLEVYGQVLDDRTIDENFQGYLSPLDVRSSYPMAKRAMENLCVLYAAEYEVPVKIARLTQTTGAGVAKDDNRVIVQFTRLAAHNENIVLHTTGDSRRPYCYTTDAISAILYVLLKGERGKAYNVANEATYISARALAEYIRKNFSPSIKVVYELKNDCGYAPATRHRLSTKELQKLGWKSQYGLQQILDRLYKTFKQ